MGGFIYEKHTYCYKLGIPMIIINDWSEFKDLKLNKNLYDSIWGDFKVESLNFDLFKKPKL